MVKAQLDGSGPLDQEVLMIRPIKQLINLTNAR